MNEILNTILITLITSFFNSGVIGFIIKTYFDKKMHLKYDRVSFYDTKYFNAYNDAWVALNEYYNATCETYTYDIDKVNLGKKLINNYRKSINNLLMPILAIRFLLKKIFMNCFLNMII